MNEKKVGKHNENAKRKTRKIPKGPSRKYKYIYKCEKRKLL